MHDDCGRVRHEFGALPVLGLGYPQTASRQGVKMNPASSPLTASFTKEVKLLLLSSIS
jgi:hypothetical protein